MYHHWYTPEYAMFTGVEAPPRVKGTLRHAPRSLSTEEMETLSDIAEVLNISAAQAYALVRSGDLRAIKVGGRGQWRIEAAELEAYLREHNTDS